MLSGFQFPHGLLSLTSLPPPKKRWTKASFNTYHQTDNPLQEKITFSLHYSSKKETLCVSKPPSSSKKWGDFWNGGDWTSQFWLYSPLLLIFVHNCFPASQQLLLPWPHTRCHQKFLLNRRIFSLPDKHTNKYSTYLLWTWGSNLQMFVNIMVRTKINKVCVLIIHPTNNGWMTPIAI